MEKRPSIADNNWFCSITDEPGDLDHSLALQYRLRATTKAQESRLLLDTTPHIDLSTQ